MWLILIERYVLDHLDINISQTSQQDLNNAYIENIWVVWQRYLDQSIPGFALRKLFPDAGLVSGAAGVRGSGGGGPV